MGIKVNSIWDLGVLDHIILTLTRASRLETVDTDMLIVASSQGWPDALPGFPPRSLRGDHQVVLVDLADDFDEIARQATLRRQLQESIADNVVGEYRPGWPTG